MREGQLLGNEMEAFGKPNEIVLHSGLISVKENTEETGGGATLKVLTKPSWYTICILSDLVNYLHVLRKVEPHTKQGCKMDCENENGL